MAKLTADQRRYFERRIHEIFSDAEYAIRENPTNVVKANPPTWPKLRALVGDDEVMRRIEKIVMSDTDGYFHASTIMTEEEEKLFPRTDKLTDEGNAKIEKARDLVEEAMDAVMLGSDAIEALKEFQEKAAKIVST